MPVSEATRKAEFFYEDLTKTLQRLCVKHDLELPSFHMVEVGKALHANLSFYKKDACEVMAEQFKDKANGMGLQPGWVGVTFLEPTLNIKLKVIGLDIDGGDNCIRVRDMKGNDYHISPATLKDRVSNHVVI